MEITKKRLRNVWSFNPSRVRSEYSAISSPLFLSRTLHDDFRRALWLLWHHKWRYSWTVCAHYNKSLSARDEKAAEKRERRRTIIQRKQHYRNVTNLTSRLTFNASVCDIDWLAVQIAPAIINFEMQLAEKNIFIFLTKFNYFSF